MKACIVSCFDNYDSRTKYVEKCLTEKGMEVIHVISDYSHSQKKRITINRSNVKLLHVLPYKKNLSLKRIWSHEHFAKHTFQLLKQLQPDIIYCLIPPNFVTYYVTKYKKKNKNVKLIFDIFDLWPESLTISKRSILIKILFYLWSALRDKNLVKADYVFTECNLYQNKLKAILKNVKTSTLYIAKENTGLELKPLQPTQVIHLCYLGTINYIIDIDLICKIIGIIHSRYSVIVHLIGIGDSKQTFFDSMEQAGAKVIDYGAIYDDRKKYEIFSKCHFGLNIMKSTVCVGMTLKSLNYFEAGLPVINNIGGDTFELVEKYNAGINVRGTMFDVNVLEKTLVEYALLRQNVKTMFREKFSTDVVMNQLNTEISKILFDT